MNVFPAVISKRDVGGATNDDVAQQTIAPNWLPSDTTLPVDWLLNNTTKSDVNCTDIDCSDTEPVFAN